MLSNGDGTFGRVQERRHRYGRRYGRLSRGGRCRRFQPRRQTDLVNVNAAGPNIDVILNGGNNTYGPPVSYTGFNGPDPSRSPISMETAIRTSSSETASGGAASILLGDGHGGFGAQFLTPSVGFGLRSIAVRDFNNDGKSDLVAVGGTRVWQFCGNGRTAPSPSPQPIRLACVFIPLPWAI